MFFRAMVVAAAVVAFAPAVAARDARSQAKEQVDFGIKVAQNGLWKEATLPLAESDRARSDLRRRPGTTSRSPTSTRASSTRRRRPTRRPLELDPKNLMIRQNYDLFKEINDRTKRRSGIASLALGLAVLARCAACTNFYEIPIETPIQPKMDVSAFPRVLVAGFISGGTDDVDANLETVRLLRSQLRSKSPLRVIEAEVLPLAEIADEREQTPARDNGPSTTHGLARRCRRSRRLPPPTWRAGRTAARVAEARIRATPTAEIRNEKDLEKFAGHLRQHRLLEEARRGIPEPADRHRHGALHAARRRPAS